MKFEEFPLKSVGVSVQLVGAIYAGDDDTYAFFFPEYADEETMGGMSIVEVTTDDWAALMKQSDLVETEVLVKAEDGQLYKAVVRKCQRNISQEISWRVFRRDGYACRYCGRDDVPLTVDHLVLWEDGGPSTEENLTSACKKCNKTRGNTQYSDWLLTRYYQNVSRRLTPEQLRANNKLAHTLDQIERVHIIRSR